MLGKNFVCIQEMGLPAATYCFDPMRSRTQQKEACDRVHYFPTKPGARISTGGFTAVVEEPMLGSRG